MGIVCSLLWQSTQAKTLRKYMTRSFIQRQLKVKRVREHEVQGSIMWRRPEVVPELSLAKYISQSTNLCLKFI